MRKLTTYIAVMIFLSLFLVASALAATSSGPTPWQFLFNFPTACSSGYAIGQLNKTTTCVFSGLYDSGFNMNMQGKNISNVVLNNATYAGPLPAECLLTNSFVSMWNFSTSTCRTLNYSTIIGYTYPELAGAGNALLCVNSAGLIYRGNATGCP